MSSISSFLTSIYGGSQSQEPTSTTGVDSSNKRWRIIGSKNKLSVQPCRRVYCSAGKDYDIALYCVHSKFYAINAKCPHMGGPLDVIVDLEELLEMPVPHALCPWHLYGYSLIDGTSPQGIKAETHLVKVEEGYVHILHEHELSIRPYETEID